LISGRLNGPGDLPSGHEKSFRLYLTGGFAILRQHDGPTDAELIAAVLKGDAASF